MDNFISQLMTIAPTDNRHIALEAISTAQHTISSDPFNIEVMDVNRFIDTHFCRPVTSSLITEPSSQDLHPDGMFSETIFGRVGSGERLTQFGFIELNTPIIAPVLFKAITKISGLYLDICKGSTYAVFDHVTKNFVPVTKDPSEVQDADTGFSFFMKHFHEIDFPLTDSYAREARVSLLDKYRDRAIYTRYLVLPAALRDIQMQGTRMTHDDINDLYWSMLSYARRLPKGSTSTLFDPVRYQIQSKAMEIYQYLEDIQIGKRGFLQGEYGARRVAMGTRNVISATDYFGLTPDDPRMLKPDETKIGLYQSAKALQPAVIYGLKTALVDPIFKSGDIAAIPVVDPESMELTYVEITPTQRVMYTNRDKLESWLNRFKNKDVRETPVTIQDVTGKTYYLQLVYDTGSTVVLCRSLSDLRSYYQGDIDIARLRPLTWVELLYMITATAANDRHAMITRYPVIGTGSSYPSKIHVATTSPARIVSLINLVTGDEAVSYPEYPILGKPMDDVVSVHQSMLAGLSGDHDGDTVSVNVVWSTDANEEIAAYLSGQGAHLNTEKQLIASNFSNLVKLTMYNLTR